MKYPGFTLLTISLLFTACNFWQSSDESSGQQETHLPIPIENSVILEVDSLLTLSEIIASLDDYSVIHINTLCVKLLPYDSMLLHALIDSCHQAGFNFMFHSNNPNEVKTNWVADFDIDGFHCTNVLSKPADYWQKKIDSFDEIKSVITISDKGIEELKNVGFSAGYGNNITAALQHVFEEGESTTLLDTALISEKYLFSKTFAAIRLASKISLGDSAAEEARLLTTFAMPGVPCITASQLEGHSAFLQTFLSLYINTPALQYGDYELYDSDSKDVFTLIRTYQGKKILFAVNTRNKPSSYNWPLNLMGIKTELLMGEKISRNGGQELLPYGFQILNFENIIGMEALELDEKK